MDIDWAKDIDQRILAKYRSISNFGFMVTLLTPHNLMLPSDLLVKAQG